MASVVEAEGRFEVTVTTPDESVGLEFTTRRNAVYILGTEPGSPAEKSGMRAGYLVKVNGTEVPTIEAMALAVKSNRTAHPALLYFDISSDPPPRMDPRSAPPKPLEAPARTAIPEQSDMAQRLQQVRSSPVPQSLHLPVDEGFWPNIAHEARASPDAQETPLVTLETSGETIEVSQAWTAAFIDGWHAAHPHTVVVRNSVSEIKMLADEVFWGFFKKRARHMQSDELEVLREGGGARSGLYRPSLREWNSIVQEWNGRSHAVSSPAQRNRMAGAESPLIQYPSHSSYASAPTATAHYTLQTGNAPYCPNCSPGRAQEEPVARVGLFFHRSAAAPAWHAAVPSLSQAASPQAVAYREPRCISPPRFADDPSPGFRVHECFGDI